jgi:hypothetical protein
MYSYVALGRLDSRLARYAAMPLPPVLTGRLMTHLIKVLADQACLDTPAGRPVGVHVDCARDLDDAPVVLASAELGCGIVTPVGPPGRCVTCPLLPPIGTGCCARVEIISQCRLGATVVIFVRPAAW